MSRPFRCTLKSSRLAKHRSSLLVKYILRPLNSKGVVDRETGSAVQAVEGPVIESFPVQAQVDCRGITQEHLKRCLALQVAYRARAQQKVQKLVAVRINDLGPALIVRLDDEHVPAHGRTTRIHLLKGDGGVIYEELFFLQPSSGCPVASDQVEYRKVAQSAYGTGRHRKADNKRGRRI